MRHSFLANCRLILADFKHSWVGLLGCEILFKTLMVSLLGPLAAWIVVQLISLSGRAAISNVDIASFLLSPLGIFTLVIFLSLGWAVEYLSRSALLLVQIGQFADRRQTFPQAALAAIARSGPIFQLALLLVAVFLLVALPVAGLAWVVYRRLLSEFDINYYLSQRPPEFWMALVIGGLLLLGLLTAWTLVYARTLFALPEAILHGSRPLQSLRQSFALTQGRTLRILRWLIGWLIVTSVASLLVTTAVQWIEELTLRAAGDSFARVAIAVGLLLTINFVAAVTVSLVAHLSQSLVVGRLYWSSIHGLAPFAAVDDAQPQQPPLDGRERPWRGLAAAADNDGDWWLEKGSWLLSRRAIWSAVLLVAFTSLLGTGLLLRGVNDADRVRVTAHRGSSKRAPENTLSAIRQAITDGADYAEIDVQETSDGEIVVMHDADLMRIAGVRRNLWDTTAEELRQIDAGSWFDPSFASERVPTLRETIEISRGKIKLNIELKFNGHDRDLVRRTLTVIDQTRFDGHCVISSLNHDALSDVRSGAPEIEVGAIVGAAIGDLARIDADFVSINVQQVDAGLIRRLHRQGKAVHVWTVNDEQTMSDMIELGVDNILTDVPDQLVELLRQRQNLSHTERLLLAFRRLVAY